MGTAHRTGIFRIEPESAGMKVVRCAEEIRKSYGDYMRDESAVRAENADALFFPRSIENISAVLEEAKKKGKRVTVSGARTGICAGAVPVQGRYIISLEKMNKILRLELAPGRGAPGYLLTAEGGIRLSELNRRIAEKDLGIAGDAVENFKNSRNPYFYPPDPTETTASLGGTAATNASGARTLFYGPTRGYVEGLEVVLASGELLRIRRGEILEQRGFFDVPKEAGGERRIPAPRYAMPGTKNSAGLYAKEGMDLIELFIGSEGILGIIAAVTVRLIEEPFSISAGVAFFPGEDEAVEFVCQSREKGMNPLAMEYFDREALLLLEEERKSQGPTSEIPAIEHFGGAVYFETAPGAGSSGGLGGSAVSELFLGWRSTIESSGGNPACAWGAVNKRDLLRLKTFRHAVPEAVNKRIAEMKQQEDRIHKVGTDIAVPDSRLRDMLSFYREKLSEARLRSVVFGHIGNNHLHVNMIPRTYEELERAKTLYREFALKGCAFGGSVSAEHGIGKLKKEYLLLQYPPEAIAGMRTVKAALDPEGMLNPGDMI